MMPTIRGDRDEALTDNGRTIGQGGSMDSTRCGRLEWIMISNSNDVSAGEGEGDVARSISLLVRVTIFACVNTFLRIVSTSMRF